LEGEGKGKGREGKRKKEGRDGKGEWKKGREGNGKQDLHPTQFFVPDYSGLPSYGSSCIIYNLPT